jgi:hypothetical protein
METLVRSSVEDPAELHLLTSWEQDRGRVREARLLSVAAHVAAIVALILMPRSLMQPPRRVEPQITPLIEPPTELTQKAPNKGPIAKEVTVEALQPRPRIQIPNSPPSTTRPQAKSSPPQPPPAPLPEPPQIQAGNRAAQPPRGLPVGPPSQAPAAADPGAGETEAGIRDSHGPATLRRSGHGSRVPTHPWPELSGNSRTAARKAG